MHDKLHDKFGKNVARIFAPLDLKITNHFDFHDTFPHQ